MGWAIGGSNPDRVKGFISSANRPGQLWGPPSLILNRYRGSFQGVKRAGREVDHSPPSSAEVRNEWSCTSASSRCLDGVDRNLRDFRLPPRWRWDMRSSGILLNAAWYPRRAQISGTEFCHYIEATEWSPMNGNDELRGASSKCLPSYSSPAPCNTSQAAQSAFHWRRLSLPSYCL
jgi:hypothetical protein